MAAEFNSQHEFIALRAELQSERMVMNKKLDEILVLVKQDTTSLGDRVTRVETHMKAVWSIFLLLVPISIQYIFAHFFGSRSS